MLKKYQILSGFTLKWIAIISMLIDHFGSIIMDGVIAPYRTDGFITFTADMPFIVRNAYMIKSICEALGSIAFPIFCFLIVEGVIHTRNIIRYGICMGIFALLSEIPYDFSHYGELFRFSLQNVMFTLCVGIFTLFILHKIELSFENNKAKYVTLTTMTIMGGMILAFLVRGEYVFLGVLAMSLLYLLRKKGYWQLLGFAPLLVASPWIVLAAIPVLLYNGQRGKGSKYFFYFFYPAHFLLYAGIAAWLSARVIGG